MANTLFSIGLFTASLTPLGERHLMSSPTTSSNIIPRLSTRPLSCCFLPEYLIGRFAAHIKTTRLRRPTAPVSSRTGAPPFHRFRPPTGPRSSRTRSIPLDVAIPPPPRTAGGGLLPLCVVRRSSRPSVHPPVRLGSDHNQAGPAG